MKGLNRVQLIGHLGKDPEVSRLSDGTCVVKFSLATSDVHKDKEGKTEPHTEWHNVVLWRGLAEIAEMYLLKGSAVFIEGKLRTKHYEDKDGNKRHITEIIGDDLIMLEKKSELV